MTRHTGKSKDMDTIIRPQGVPQPLTHPKRQRTVLSAVEFQLRSEQVYIYLSQCRWSTSKEIKEALGLTNNQWRDTLFYLRHHYGVISVPGKGIFKDKAVFITWLRMARRRKEVPA